MGKIEGKRGIMGYNEVIQANVLAGQGLSNDGFRLRPGNLTRLIEGRFDLLNLQPAQPSGGGNDLVYVFQFRAGFFQLGIILCPDQAPCILAPLLPGSSAQFPLLPRCSKNRI